MLQSYLDNIQPRTEINGPILYRSKWFAPYRNGKPQLANKYYKSAGTYLIKSKQTGRILYVGYSSNNLKRTLYRHFQQWKSRSQETRTYDKSKYLVKFYRLGSKAAARYEKFLIDKIKPKHNKLKYPSLFKEGETETPYKDFFEKYTPEEETKYLYGV
jgi:hypothetical protein